MGRTFKDYDDEFETDPNFETKVIDGKRARILKDGGVFRTRLMMLDGADEILRDTALVAAREKQRAGKQRHGFSDADARRFGLEDGRQMHRPGWRFRTDHAADEKIALGYAIHDQQDERAWLGDKAAPADDEVLDRETAYRLRDEADQNAWRTGNLPLADATGAGDAPVPGAMRMSNTMRPGMSCTINGNCGMMVETSPGSGWLTCEPIASDADDYFKGDAKAMQKDHARRMADLYAERDRELQDAWRGGK